MNIYSAHFLCEYIQMHVTTEICNKSNITNESQLAGG